MSHVPVCMVCGVPTDSGPTVAGKLRPLCALHRDGTQAGFYPSQEYSRGAYHTPQTGTLSESPAFARAFTDWLNRVRAERKNHNPEAA